tara:strand:- start:2277 stop:2489 length:213 start_codon:yes stop_codon:yes gene_type:complete
MEGQWIIPVAILSIILIILCTFICKMFIIEYHSIDHEEPTRTNNVHPVPIVIGVKVNNLEEDIEIITIFE